MRKPYHYINIVFNISPHEWPRVLLSWFLKFIVQGASVMVSTILLALFLEKFGITRLPILYILSAVAVVIGSIIFSFILERFTKQFEILLFTLIASSLLFFTPLAFAEKTFFFFLLFLVSSVFLTQLNIIVALFIEELFSPLESQRTFPIIESSEPIGGIFAGTILTLGVTLFHLSALHLLQYAAFTIAGIIPVLLIFVHISNAVPRLEHSSERALKMGNKMEKTVKGLRHIKGMAFLKGLTLIVFLQFAFVNLIEYQYTSVLDASVSQHEVNTDGQDHHADALTHGLAFWHVMFSLLAFFAQILSASRIHSHFGIIRSMSLHPLIMLGTSFIMLFKFGFVSAVTARGIFEVSGIMHRTTYHASFYALKKSIREHVKEFMEGMVRPFGVIVGTLILMGILAFIPEHFQHTGITIAMFFIMTMMFIILRKMKKQYTLVAKKNLDAQTSDIEKLEAIEILAQKGHDDVVIILGKHIHDKQHEYIQCKILDTFGLLGDVNAIPDIIRSFDSKNKNVQLSAVNALTRFKNLGQHFFTQSFAKHRVTEALQNLFMTTQSKKIKSSVVQVFKNINNADVIPFLLKVLDNKDEEVVDDAIYVCGLFQDVNSAYYIEKFLTSPYPRVKSAAIIALWNFPSYRLKCLIQLTSMLESKDEEVKISGIYSLGEIRAVQEIPKLEKFLESSNEFIKMHAAIALAKMNNTDSVEVLIDLLSHGNKKLIETIRKLLREVPEYIRHMVENTMLHIVIEKIHLLLSEEGNAALDELPTEILIKLKDHYESLSEIKEVIKIEEELEKRYSEEILSKK